MMTEQDLEFQSLKGGCRRSSESTRQNATLFEISCTGLFSNFVAGSRNKNQGDISCDLSAWVIANDSHEMLQHQETK